MVYENSIAARALMLIPMLLIQHFSFLFFSKEYDRAMMVQWKKREARLGRMEMEVQPQAEIAVKEARKASFTGNAIGRTERISELY